MKNINEIKKKLLKERGTENFHLGLEDLDIEDSRKIVESLSKDEIFIKVNHRTFEEDYICDYIDYLWDISRKAFWRHIFISLDENLGIIWGGDMIYFEKMCNNLVPKKILFRLLDLIAKNKLELSDLDNQDIEAIGCVLRAQVKDFDRWKVIKNYVKINYTNSKDLIDDIEKLTKTKCNYRFGN